MVSKKLHKFILALVLFAMPVLAISQVPTYTTPGGTSNNNFPFNSTSSNKVQWVYTPSEFTPNLQAGLITHVYFRSANSGSSTKTFSDLRISIGNVNYSTFPNGTFATGLTVCYNQSVTINIPSNGWFGVQLTTPYVYDGTSNIVIEATITNTNGLTVSQNTTNGNKRIWGGRTATSGSTGSGHAACGLEILTCSTAITKQPVPQIVCEGQQTSFDITAIDATDYQWQVDEGNGFTDLIDNNIYSNVKSNTLTIQNIPGTLDSNIYRCMVSKNSCADSSTPVMLNVNRLVKIESFPAKDTTCINATKDLEVKADGSIVHYKWQIWISGQGFVDVPNAPPFTNLGHKLNITGVPDTLDGSIFRCVLEGLCDNDTTHSMTLQVNPIPKVAVPPADVVTDQGNNVMFEVQASAAGARYQWQVAAPDTFVNINEGGIYKGVKTNRLEVKGVSYAQNNFQFRCVVMTGDGCIAPGDTSVAAILTVNPPASVKDIYNNESILLYPNPVQGTELFIKTKGNSNVSYTYMIIDKTGKTVMIGNLDSDITTVNIGRLAADVYTVRVTAKDGETFSISRFTKL